jgi:hypothetical protein
MRLWSCGSGGDLWQLCDFGVTAKTDISELASITPQLSLTLMVCPYVVLRFCSPASTNDKENNSCRSTCTVDAAGVEVVLQPGTCVVLRISSAKAVRMRGPSR